MKHARFLPLVLVLALLPLTPLGILLGQSGEGTTTTETEKKEPEAEKKEPEAEKKEPEAEKKEPEAEKKEPEAEKKEPEAEKKMSRPARPRLQVTFGTKVAFLSKRQIARLMRAPLGRPRVLTVRAYTDAAGSKELAVKRVDEVVFYLKKRFPKARFFYRTFPPKGKATAYNNRTVVFVRY